MSVSSISDKTISKHQRGWLEKYPKESTAVLKEISNFVKDNQSIKDYQKMKIDYFTEKLITSEMESDEETNLKGIIHSHLNLPEKRDERTSSLAQMSQEALFENDDFFKENLVYSKSSHHSVAVNRDGQLFLLLNENYNPQQKILIGSGANKKIKAAIQYDKVKNRVYTVTHFSEADLKNKQKVQNEYELLTLLKGNPFFPKVYGITSVPPEEGGQSVKKKDWKIIMIQEHCGADLARSKKGRLLNEQELYQVLVDVHQAVALLHQHEIVHCDLKPANILTKKGKKTFGRVADFDLSCKKDAFLTDPKKKGTLNYFPPEYLKSDYDPEKAVYKVDVWSQGITVWEILLGKSPFYHAGKNQQKKVNALMLWDKNSVRKTLESNPSWKPLIDTALEEYFYQTLNPLPEERITSQEAASLFIKIAQEQFPGKIELR